MNQLSSCSGGFSGSSVVRLQSIKSWSPTQIAPSPVNGWHSELPCAQETDK